MNHLFLTIILITVLFVIFRLFTRYRVHTFYAVVINYYVCIVTGALFLSKVPDQTDLPHEPDWVHWGIFTGALFVPCFYLMGLTVEKVSVTVSTVANKMSLVIPVVFSFLFLNKGPDDFSVLNGIGIALALGSIVLTSLKKEAPAAGGAGTLGKLLLPLSIFVMGGAIDTMVNYANYTYLKGEAQAIFPLVMFTTAAVTGTGVMLFHIIIGRRFPKWKDVAGGIVLGIPNYFSMYFLLKTLSDFNNDGALVYPVVNIGVIALAALSSVLLFRERLSPWNLCGICLSVVSLILVFWK